ncbi:MAG: hypothetical protein PVH55_12330, partial [Desulfobacterales bacterium]
MVPITSISTLSFFYGADQFFERYAGTKNDLHYQVLALGRFDQFSDFLGAIFLHALDVFFRCQGYIVTHRHNF